MKRFILTSYLMLLTVNAVFAQSQPYRVVFDLTSKDSLDHKAVIRWIREISKPNPKVEVEVVMYAKGLEMVMPEKITRPEEGRIQLEVSLRNTRKPVVRAKAGMMMVTRRWRELVTRRTLSATEWGTDTCRH